MADIGSLDLTLYALTLASSKPTCSGHFLGYSSCRRIEARVKPLIGISIEHYESLLRYASGTSPLYLRLKSAVKTDANIIAMLCDLDGAEKLRKVAKHFCPDAVPQIEKAIRLARVPA
jgi:hypothetical protein